MSFKANDYKDNVGNFDPFPAGDYTLALVKAERKESGNSPGNYYIECQISVIKGEHKKRILFLTLPFKSTEEGMNYAKGMLSHMMLAIGIDTIKDVWNLTPLMNRPFKAKVKITIDKNGKYDPKNEIQKFYPADKSISSENNTPDFGNNNNNITLSKKEKKEVKKQIKTLKKEIPTLKKKEQKKAKKQLSKLENKISPLITPDDVPF